MGRAGTITNYFFYVAFFIVLLISQIRGGEVFLKFFRWPQNKACVRTHPLAYLNKEEMVNLKNIFFRLH
jgi:hypothetical protein